MKKEVKDYIEDIIFAMQNAINFVEGMRYDDFIKDIKTQYAVVRSLEIIGEAAKQIPASIKNKYPEIPWKQMAGMRDKLIHEYFGVNYQRVWETLKKDIPKLLPIFQKIFKDLNKNE